MSTSDDIIYEFQSKIDEQASAEYALGMNAMMTTLTHGLDLHDLGIIQAVNAQITDDIRALDEEISEGEAWLEECRELDNLSARADALLVGRVIGLQTDAELLADRVADALALMDAGQTADARAILSDIVSEVRGERIDPPAPSCDYYDMKIPETDQEDFLTKMEARIAEVMHGRIGTTEDLGSTIFPRYTFLLKPFYGHDKTEEEWKAWTKETIHSVIGTMRVHLGISEEGRIAPYYDLQYKGCTADEAYDRIGEYIDCIEGGLQNIITEAYAEAL